MTRSRHHFFAPLQGFGVALVLCFAGTGSVAEAAASIDQGAIRVLIAPEVETTLVSEMAGRISQLNAALGASVARSALVVALDCSEAQARLQMADADAVSALETLATKKRLRELEAAGEMEVVLAAAANDRARGAVALAHAQAGQCKVEAPFAGRVARVYVKPHQGVGVGTPLVDLVSDGPLKLRLNVPSVYLRQLRVGTPFSVVVDETGKTYSAKVSAINSRVDAVAQTVEIEGRFDGGHADLLAGMSGVAQFRAQRGP
jgi:RND family efflux transporter MFP subunit